MKQLKELKKKSLSDSDIMNLLKGQSRIMSYPTLTEYDNLDDAMGKYGAIVLLYETKEHYGHWTAVFKLDDNTVEFFDSYAMRPDDELAFIPEHFRISNDELYPHLTYLLYSSGYDIEYNDYKLQSKKKDMNTCGRHVVTRLLFRWLDIDEYANMIKQFNMSPDNFVTYFTNKISNYNI